VEEEEVVGSPSSATTQLWKEAITHWKQSAQQKEDEIQVVAGTHQITIITALLRAHVFGSCKQTVPTHHRVGKDAGREE
jgi:hypothetical protein